jgi:hypothetical protein
MGPVMCFAKLLFKVTYLVHYIESITSDTNACVIHFLSKNVSDGSLLDPIFASSVLGIVLSISPPVQKNAHGIYWITVAILAVLFP